MNNKILVSLTVLFSFSFFTSYSYAQDSCNDIDKMIEKLETFNKYNKEQILNNIDDLNSTENRELFSVENLLKNYSYYNKNCSDKLEKLRSLLHLYNNNKGIQLFNKANSNLRLKQFNQTITRQNLELKSTSVLDYNDKNIYYNFFDEKTDKFFMNILSKDKMSNLSFYKSNFYFINIPTDNLPIFFNKNFLNFDFDLIRNNYQTYVDGDSTNAKITFLHKDLLTPINEYEIKDYNLISKKMRWDTNPYFFKETAAEKFINTQAPKNNNSEKTYIDFLNPDNKYIVFKSFEEAEKKLNNKLLKPKVLPSGFVLSDLSYIKISKTEIFIQSYSDGIADMFILYIFKNNEIDKRLLDTNFLKEISNFSYYSIHNYERIDNNIFMLCFGELWPDKLREVMNSIDLKK